MQDATTLLMILMLSFEPVTVLHFSDYNVKELVFDCPWSTIIEQLEKIESPLSYAWGVTSHLNGVRNSLELRIAYEKVTCRCEYFSAVNNFLFS